MHNGINCVKYYELVKRIARDAVGVTPGLRRRRERAERHKSFLKEQQEAVANGIFAALERREEIGEYSFVWVEQKVYCFSMKFLSGFENPSFFCRIFSIFLRHTNTFFIHLIFF